VTGLGFIGTGHLASFFVEGLSRVDAGYDIMVSPRNAARASDLAHRFGVAIAENQQIADRCDLVVASVLPKDAANVLGGLRFRVGQTVLSVMAGVSLSELRDLVAPAQAVVAMMPGLANAFNAGPSAMYPETWLHGRKRHGRLLRHDGSDDARRNGLVCLSRARACGCASPGGGGSEGKFRHAA
jgi:pyrroline-5-carboxylate reductase